MTRTNVVQLRRKVRPLQKTYDPSEPYVIEREDRDDGSITYEIYDCRPDSYRFVCSLNDNCDFELEDDEHPQNTAKVDAERIVRGLNLLVKMGLDNR